MPFAEHIRRCNNFDPSRVVPLVAGERRIGLLLRENAVALRPFGDVFAVEPDRVRLVATEPGEAGRHYRLPPRSYLVGTRIIAVTRPGGYLGRGGR